MIRNTDEKHFLSLGEAATELLEDPVIQPLQHVVRQIQRTKHQKRVRKKFFFVAGYGPQRTFWTRLLGYFFP
jgi:hypothetical protein